MSFVTLVNAFTYGRLMGNPAAVCILDQPAGESWMQVLAAQMNLSETAFIRRDKDGFHLRWFTPTMEVDLCGHATLASAHVLWEQGYVPPHERLRFQTRSGELRATKDGDWIELDFPMVVPRVARMPRGLEEAIGAKPIEFAATESNYVAEVESEKTLRALKPDFEKIKALPVEGIYVTSRSERSEIDFVSRCFFPKLGIPEDPVTGSAHCTLGPYWKARLDKDRLTACQISPRGGLLRIQLRGGRAFISGRADTIEKRHISTQSS